MDKTYIVIIIAVASLLLLINTITLILYLRCNKKIKKSNSLYEKTLAKFNSTENINDEFISIYTRIGNAEKVAEDSIKKYEELIEKNKMMINKIGLMKYNAYDDTENKLSYALSILDSNLDGVLLNHIHSRHGDNSYIKEVKKGKVEGRITEEEAEAIKQATYKNI